MFLQWRMWHGFLRDLASLMKALDIVAIFFRGCWFENSETCTYPAESQ